MSTILHYFYWFAGLGTVAVLIATAVIAPSALQVAASWLMGLTPLIKGLADWIVSFGQLLWKGFIVVLDNGAPAIVFVLTMVSLAYLWPHHAIIHSGGTTRGGVSYSISHDKAVADKAIKDLRKDFQFVPRAGAQEHLDDQSSEAGWLPTWGRP